MDEAGLIQLIGSLLLVTVTLYYAVSNHLILRENRKDRRIRSIDDKLRNFYYPLLNSLETNHTLHRRILESKDLLYLADDELEKALRDFCGFDVALTVGEVLLSDKGKDERASQEMFPRIKEMIEDRIMKLKRELDKLKR